MEKKYFLPIVLLFTFTLLLLLPKQAAARSFKFDSVIIEAAITPNGSMLIEEHRTASFDGEYSGMYMWIKTRDPMRIDNLSVSEEKAPYKYNPCDTYGPAGTYFTREKPDQLYIDWSFNAADETRTFILQYIVQNAVRVHNDTAELYFQFVGNEWDTKSEQVNVRLKLPRGADIEDIRAWGHGPLHGDVTILNNREILWEIAHLPANTYLEGRVTFPISLVPDATHLTGENALPDILKEEQQLANRSNQERRYETAFWFIAVIIFLAGIGYAYNYWKQFCKRFPVSFSGDYCRELPADYTPAELGLLWRFEHTKPVDMTATLVDLARKGYLRLEELAASQQDISSRDYLITRTEKTGNLENHEHDLLDFLFIQISPDGKPISVNKLKQMGKKSYVISTFWNKWRCLTLAPRSEILNFFDTHNSTKKTLSVGISVFLILLGCLAAVTGFPQFPLLIITGSIILSVTQIRRRSPGGEEDYARWKAFRRFLVDFSQMETHQLPSLAIWEHYLVYAITLGVAKEVIEQLQIVYPTMESGGCRFGSGWLFLYGAHNSTGFGNITNSFNNITSGITQSFRTAAGSSSSGSGRGGGFSGGGFGGGGFGGGGGGAR